MALWAAALGLWGCGSDHSQKTGTGAPFVRTPVSSDLEALAKYIELPVRPAAASWETLAMSGPGTPGPTDWYLIAVLHYGEPELSDLMRRSQLSNEPAVLDGPEIRPWFPSDLKAAWVDAGGGHYRFSGPVYKADLFFKGTLHDGYFCPLEKGGEAFLMLQCCTATIPGK